jgi:hypothetical protein
MGPASAAARVAFIQKDRIPSQTHIQKVPNTLECPMATLPPLSGPRGLLDLRPSIVQPRSQSAFSAFPMAQSFAPTLDSSDEEISAAQREAQRRFDQCMAQIRQLERTFVIRNRRSDLNGRRVISRSTENVASLYHELRQLSTQRALFERKMGSVKSSIADARNRGINALSAPLMTGFQSFQAEFDRALANIDSIFGGLNSRIQDCLLTWAEVDHLPETVARLEGEIGEMAQKEEEMMRDLEATKIEVGELMVSSRDAIVLQFRRRLDALSRKIEALEVESGQALAQSENAIADAQAAQIEFRGQFGKALEEGMSGFNRKVQAMKGRIVDLRRMRGEQIEMARARVIAWSDEARKAQNDSVENVPRVSLQPEIRALKKELRELKQQLRRKLVQKREGKG